MHTDLFTAESFPVQERPIKWREALLPHHLRARLGEGPEPMHATLLAARTPLGITMARISSSAQSLARRAAPAQEVWLSLHIAGQAVLHDGHEARALEPGDLVYGTAAAELDLSFSTDFRQFILRIPAQPLQSRLAGPLYATAGHLSGRQGMGRVLAGTLGALAESFEALDEAQLQSVEQSLPEMLAVSLAGQAHAVSQGGLRAPQEALLQRVLRHIDLHLAEPGLSLAELAQRERVSQRSLQKLFEASGKTFTTHVREKRLARCRSDLGNPLYGHLSISDICYRWGFNDAAHFSHAFRDHFGISPRQYRDDATRAGQRSLEAAVHRGWPSGYASQAAPARGPASAPTEPAGAGEPGEPGRARHHHLCANEHTVHWGYFSRSLAPALRVKPGDLVTVETLTQHAYDDYDRMIHGDSGAQGVFHWTSERKNIDRRGAGPADASIYGRGSGEGFGVHICTGPIHVEGAEPGDIVEIRIVDVLPRLSANARFAGRAFGSNAATWWGFHYKELLTEPKPREVVTIYEVDWDGRDGGCACAHAVYNYRWVPQRDPDGVLHPTIDYPGVPVYRTRIHENHDVLRGVSIPVRPHFGVIAVAPAESGMVDSIPPAYFGGNIDNWRVGKGATVYLRVGVDGALLSIGDPHASQGDSELCGTAIECSLTGVFQLLLHKADTLAGKPFADIDYPLLETPTEWVLHGFSHPQYLREFGAKAGSEIYEKSSLDLAMRDAFRKTRRFLMSAHGLSEDEAISLMSVAVDFGITQVVDGNVGVHSIIRKSLFAGRRHAASRAQASSHSP